MSSFDQTIQKITIALQFLYLMVFSSNMTKYQLKTISHQLDVGTRIHWDNTTQSVYFVDVPTSIVYKFNATNEKLTEAKVGSEPLAFMFPVEGLDTIFIAGLGRKLAYVEWDGTSKNVSKVEIIAEVDTETGLSENRLNGAKVDPFGRLWAGTMGSSDESGLAKPGLGSLYMLSNGKLKKQDHKIGVSNGIAWDIKEKKMFYIDTLVPGVFQYDYDPTTGDIANKTMIFDFPKNNISGLPDGLTIDSDGNLWVCAIYGWKLVKFNPKNGTVLQEIEFPTPEITSATFGGRNLDKLFVTTARIPINGSIPEDPAGRTYVVNNIGVTGYLDTRYKP